jgi:hypothetical protein
MCYYYLLCCHVCRGGGRGRKKHSDRDGCDPPLKIIYHHHMAEQQGMVTSVVWVQSHETSHGQNVPLQYCVVLLGGVCGDVFCGEANLLFVERHLRCNRETFQINKIEQRGCVYGAWDSACGRFVLLLMAKLERIILKSPTSRLVSST